MTNTELIAMLSKYPEGIPVSINTSQGVDENIIAVEDDSDDYPDIRPMTIFICSERN